MSIYKNIGFFFKFKALNKKNNNETYFDSL